MATRGWSCHLVLEWLPDDSSWIQGYHNLGVQIHCLARPRTRFDWKCIKDARRLLQRLRPDIILCENIHSSPMIAAAAARVPVRIWIKHAMNSCFEECRQPRFKDRLMITTRLTCSLATRVLAVSGAVRNELVDLGINKVKILVRPNPRQFSYLPEAQSRAAIRTALGYAGSHVVFVSIGHAVPVKGWDLLVQAFAKVAAVDTRARLLLVGGINRSGETHFAAALMAAVGRKGLDDRVRFTGHTPEIASFLAASDVLVMPSRSEGFSCALIEGLDAGLPCVAARVGIAEDVIRAGHNGLLVERGQEQPLAEALITICRDDDLRRRLALNAFVPGGIPTLPEYAEGLASDFEILVERKSP